MRARCGGAERTDGAGRMEAARIVAGRHNLADFRLGLVACDECGNQVTAAGAATFGERQSGGQDGGRRMAHHPDIDVIVVERVRRGTIDQRRLTWRGPPTAPDERGTLVPAFGSHLFGKYRNQRLAGALHGYGYPVEDAMLSDRNHVGR